MTHPVIDVYNHCLPPRYIAACRDLNKELSPMFRRAVATPGMSDLKLRNEMLDKHGDFAQILSLASPAPESIAPPDRSPALARIANEDMADWYRRHPKHYPGFVAALPLNNVEASLREATHAIEQLGALGIQLYTTVQGKPLDHPHFQPLFDLIATLNKAIWIHPIRTCFSGDYPGEPLSKYELFWSFGWPHETSVCIGRLVFSGLFEKWPQIKVITHHGGGTLPLMEGRLTEGIADLGARYPKMHRSAARHELQHPVMDSFRKVYADTATFGSDIGIEAAAAFFGEDHILFASDFPYAAIGPTLAAASRFGQKVLYRNATDLFYEI